MSPSPSTLFDIRELEDCDITFVGKANELLARIASKKATETVFGMGKKIIVDVKRYSRTFSEHTAKLVYPKIQSKFSTIIVECNERVLD